MNTFTAVKIAETLFSVAVNALTAHKKLNELIIDARSEGRDISAAEIESLQHESAAITERALDILRGIKQ